MTDEKGSNQADRQLNERLAALEEKLEARRAAEKKATAANPSKGGWGKAMKMSSEFIAAILVGAMMGYLVDSFAGTQPWGMIVLLLLGFVAGVINVLRSSGEVADPYRAGWANSPKGTRDHEVAKKAPDDLYDDTDRDAD